MSHKFYKDSQGQYGRLAVRQDCEFETRLSCIATLWKESGGEEKKEE